MTAKTSMNCLDELQINRFLESEVETEREQQILAHVATCQTCQEALERIAGNDQFWSEVKQHMVEQRERFDDEATHDEWDGGRQQRDLLKVKQMLGPTENPEMIGRLGQYEICGIIGRGSAGIVVKALDTRLNRYVAIKMLAPVYSTNGSSRRRFEREGRAIASVKDPNVVPIHTVGEYQGTPYIVMQYVPDGSLQQRIDRQGPLSTRDVACLGMQVANGLAAAHRRGIVHRDVKPANVLLESGVESALVTDFGLARVVDEATMTRSGAISGTPQFMSPEQARGESVDPRSDLFSLGSVMYAACTGHSPFRAESVFGVIKRVCESEPRAVREFNPDIEPWLVALISKLHAKEPQRRFDSAEQVAEILSRELAHLENPTLVEVPPRPWWEKSRKKVSPTKKAVPTGASMKTMIGAGILAGCLFIALGMGAWMQWGPMIGGWIQPSKASGPGNGGGAVFAESPESWSELNPQALLDLLQQENQELARFDHSISEELQVSDGGKLILRTNLGAIAVKTHDQPTVKLVLVHTVGAKDQATADKLFESVKVRYQPVTEEERNWDYASGTDAMIVAEFPVGKLTDEEIEKADDLEALKEQLLIRKNSHFRNARFELMVPKQFNLDVDTMAGPIEAADIDGWVHLHSFAGPISAGSITGDATLETAAGDIVVGQVSGRLTAATKGGHIEAMQLDSESTVESLAGGIEIGISKQPIHLRSSSGRVRVWMAEEAVDASVDAGNIEVNFVKQPSGDSQLSSQVGRIQVGYVDGLDFEILANSAQGRVQSPFSEKSKRSLQHTLNNGKHKLNASTQTGGVSFEEVELADLKKNLESQRMQQEASRAFQKAYDTHFEGRIEEAVALHMRAAEFASYRGIATYNLGCAYSLLGQKEKALKELNNAYNFGFRDVEQYQTDTDLDSLRDEAQFKELMEKLEGKTDKFDQTNCSSDSECKQRA